LQYGATTVAIDCGPDFRQQMLAAKVGHLDAIIMTHEHNDHMVGLDDVRPYNFKQMSDMPVYATTRVQEQFRQRFAYVFKEQNKYPGAPMVQLLTIDKETPFDIGDLHIIPIEASASLLVLAPSPSTFRVPPAASSKPFASLQLIS
jgi:phosphoribosyl 1,2-cyclic phosphate phosphodiesterase